MVKWSLVPLLCAVAFSPLVFVSSNIGVAQVMQSDNYSIESDSINVGGGLSDSESYSLESTTGELATGSNDSETYALRAGYQQMQEVFISLTGLEAVALSPTIPGVSGGESNGSTSATVITDSPSGYSLSIRSEQSPAMVSGANTIADYNTNATPDRLFAIGLTDAHFGFSPFGDDVVLRYQNDGSVCGAVFAVSVDLECWSGLSTSPTIIAENTNSNHPTGAATKINFRVGVGGSVIQPVGVYVATTTVTALPL